MIILFIDTEYSSPAFLVSIALVSERGRSRQKMAGDTHRGFFQAKDGKTPGAALN